MHGLRAIHLHEPKGSCIWQPESRLHLTVGARAIRAREVECVAASHAALSVHVLKRFAPPILHPPGKLTRHPRPHIRPTANQAKCFCVTTNGSPVQPCCSAWASSSAGKALAERLGNKFLIKVRYALLETTSAQCNFNKGKAISYPPSFLPSLLSLDRGFVDARSMVTRYKCKQQFDTPLPRSFLPPYNTCRRSKPTLSFL